jgi:hypothetical protein
MVDQVIHLTPSGTQVVECPYCRSPLPFRRTRNPIIDSTGFETYQLFCAGCRERFSGIIDPYDHSLLVEPK